MRSFFVLFFHSPKHIDDMLYIVFEKEKQKKSNQSYTYIFFDLENFKLNNKHDEISKN